jgi:protein-S-isoprenylcysteine O-methyltransferase Ste14
MQMDRSRNQRFITAVKSAVAWVILMSLILVMAGRFDYGRGWVFGVVNLLILFVLLVFFPELPAIMRERAKPGPKTKAWDRVFWALFGPLNLTVFVSAVLDGGRFLWTRQLSVIISSAAVLFYVLGAALHFAAIRVNEFYSSTVSIDAELGHKVIRGGPYRLVRHPGYIGILLMMTSLPLMFGSLWALLPASAVLGLIIARAALEDKALIKELPGYAEYARDVRSRLIPGLW